MTIAHTRAPRHRTSPCSDEQIGEHTKLVSTLPSTPPFQETCFVSQTTDSDSATARHDTVAKAAVQCPPNFLEGEMVEFAGA